MRRAMDLDYSNLSNLRLSSTNFESNKCYHLNVDLPAYKSKNYEIRPRQLCSNHTVLNYVAAQKHYRFPVFRRHRYRNQDIATPRHQGHTNHTLRDTNSSTTRQRLPTDRFSRLQEMEQPSENQTTQLLEIELQKGVKQNLKKPKQYNPLTAEIGLQKTE